MRPCSQSNGSKSCDSLCITGCLPGILFLSFSCCSWKGRSLRSFLWSTFCRGSEEWMTREIPSELISYVWTASWENPHPEKYRAQAATGGPFVRAPIHAPRWKRRYCPLGAWGACGGRGWVEVIPGGARAIPYRGVAAWGCLEQLGCSWGHYQFVTLPSWLFFAVQLKQLLCWHLGDESVLLINGAITLWDLSLSEFTKYRGYKITAVTPPILANKFRFGSLFSKDFWYVACLAWVEMSAL